MSQTYGERKQELQREFDIVAAEIRALLAPAPKWFLAILRRLFPVIWENENL